METPARPDAAAPAPERRRFRRTLLSVMAVQVATLLLLWLIQLRYGG
jgi:ferric-dicitrate binding protein FerR (iron transport regulator)